MWVLIDNYDSFTHILHHYLLQTGNDCLVFRNDEITLDALIALNPTRIIISPGPGRPGDAGITMEVVSHFQNKIPILGICLGHQALGLFFGAKLKHAPEPVHGKVSKIFTQAHSLFEGIENPFPAMRYHSLCIENIEGTGLYEIAKTEDGINMAVAHESLFCIGFQAHPESIGTPQGLKLLQNWAAMFG